MKREILKYKIIFLLLFLFYNETYAQVQVVLKQPPQNEFKLEHMWRVTLTNTTNNTYTVYLYGKATEASAGFIVDAITKSFILPPGVLLITAGKISSISLQKTNKKYEDIVKSTGNVPSGDYEICVSVINTANEELLGTDCVEQAVFNFTQLEPVSPSDGSEVREPYPVFSWLPPTPLTSGQVVSYTLRVVEVISRQSAYDAIQSNPGFFEKGNLYATTFLFPVSSRGFNNERSYAWKVSAYVKGVLISESEVWEFKYYNETQNAAKNLKSKFKIKPEKGSISLKTPEYSLSEKEISESLIQKRKNPVFVFSGSSKIEGSNSNRQGTNQTIPQRYANWEINPSLYIYSIPFGVNILLTTQGSSARQNINSFALVLNPSIIKDKIEQRALEEIEKNKEKIEQRIREETEKIKDEKKKKERTLKLKEKFEERTKEKGRERISGGLKFFSYFQSLGIGVTYPNYSRYTLSGVPVTGADIEFNPGLFYFAVTGLKNKKPIDNISYRRNLYAGRIGLGQKNGTHFYFTALYARDDENSIKVTDTSLTLTPKANYLFGTEGKLSLFKNKFTIEGEAAVSLLTRDVRDADLSNSAIPDFVRKIFKPKISSSIDYTYSIKSVFDNVKSNTRISAGVKMVGPGYSSLGVPNLAGDKFSIEAKAEQKFFKKRMTASVFFKWDRDNLVDWKSSTTTTTAFGINAGVNFKNLPFFRIIFSPYLQKNNAGFDTLKIDNRTILFSAVTGYNYSKWGLNTTTSISYSLQQSKSFTGANDFTVNNLVLNEAIVFKIPLTISGSAGMIHSDYIMDYSRIILFDLSSSYVLFDLWQNTGGINFTIEKDKNRKLGLYLNSVITLWKFIVLDVRAEQNIYRDWIQGQSNYNEFMLRSTLSTTW